MARTKPSIIKILVFIILIFAIFIWFWYSTAQALKFTFSDPQLGQIQTLALPALPLILGVSLLTIYAILQDIPSWSRWVISLIISLPVFFVSAPPNPFAAIGALILFLAIYWFLEKIKTETEDHLKIRISHLSQAGGLPLLISIIILVITLLALAKIAPQISDKGLTIPKTFFIPDSFINKMLPSNFISSNQKNNRQTDIQTNLSQDSQVLTQISEQLNVTFEEQDTLADIYRKSLEFKVNQLFRGSISSILLAIGLIIFLSLTILRYPLLLIIGAVSYLIFNILKSTQIIEVLESVVEAQLPFLGQDLDK